MGGVYWIGRKSPVARCTKCRKDTQHCRHKIRGMDVTFQPCTCPPLGLMSGVEIRPAQLISRGRQNDTEARYRCTGCGVTFTVNKVGRPALFTRVVW